METRESQFLGLWGWLALVGFGLIALARLISVLSNFDDIDDDQKVPVLFSILGGILLSGGLFAAGLFMRAFGLGVRVALCLGGAFLLITDSSTIFGLFASGF